MIEAARDGGVFPWQREIWERLQAYVTQERIPQALLLIGAPGFGTRSLADAYAALLTCETPAYGFPCGACRACELQRAETHPDYLSIGVLEDKTDINVDQIRALIAKLMLKPQYARQRLVIIQPAEALNANAANAFLKFLEEPTERTSILLITEQAMRLPATLRSRCQKIVCPNPKPAIGEQWLREQGVLADHGELLRLAHGSPLLAKDYANQDLLAFRRAVFEDWRRAAEGNADMPALAEQWQKLEAERLAALLEWVSGWLIDMVKLAHAADVNCLSNPDLARQLSYYAERLNLIDLYAFYDSVIDGLRLLRTQANKQLLLERLLIDWRRLQLAA